MRKHRRRLLFWMFWMWFPLLLCLVTPRARAVSREVVDAVPRAAQEYLGDAGYGGKYDSSSVSGADSANGPDCAYGADSAYGLDGVSGADSVSGAERFTQGIGSILDRAGKAAGRVFRNRLRGAASVLLAVILCGAARCGMGTEGELAVSVAGALAVTALSAGSLEDLIGLGWQTIQDLDTFSRALLPALAAATAASGAPSTATILQVLTMLLSGLLLKLMDGLLMPLLYLYIGVLTASCALPGNRLDLLADGLKRAVTGLLTTALLGFTIYLSMSRVISGAADSTALRLTKAAVSHAVPVVGGILAEASEAALAGAGLLRNAVGVFGMLTAVAVCVNPFLQLGIQYLLYKGASFLAAASGMPDLCRLLDGLGGAFALTLGMTAACAMLLLVSALCFVSAAAG